MRYLLPFLPLLLLGCVERTMTITSEPSGALVYLNGEEVGRTPLTRDFLWYGDYDVQVRHEGHETLDTHEWVVAPWWQWPPFDLVAEIMPIRLTDHRQLHYQLVETSPGDVNPDQMLDRAAAMRSQLGASRVAPADQAGN